MEVFWGANPLLLDEALLILRAAIGICFCVHGLGKLGLVGPGNMEGFVGWLKSLNVPRPEISARMAMLSELIGGSLLTFGLFTRPACIFIFFTMMVAVLLGHKGGGYLITNTPPGHEYALNLAIIVLFFFLIGPGQYSLDAWLF